MALVGRWVGIEGVDPEQILRHLSLNRPIIFPTRLQAESADR